MPERARELRKSGKAGQTSDHPTPESATQPRHALHDPEPITPQSSRWIRAETRDRSGTFYPLAERIRSWSGEAPHQLLDHLHRDLITYSGGELHDDIAALVARRRPNR
ncbi:SpoIIE family protein phosphatase [Streptomyces sp. S1A1-7]|nr:SpoIIE family protein phosphatase [Streptomyces sp. S1A1-7]